MQLSRANIPALVLRNSYVKLTDYLLLIIYKCSMPNRVVHFEIEARDSKRASKFYSDAFGWDIQPQGKEYGDYIVVETGKKDEMGINGGIFQTMNGEDKKLNAYRCIIGVDDIQKAIKDVKAAGGKIIGEKPDDIKYVGLFIRCEDTEGNVFALLQPSPDMMPEK